MKIVFCFWPQFSFIPHKSLIHEACSPFTSGASDGATHADLTPGVGKLGSCVLLSEFRGMKFRKKKRDRGPRWTGGED